jgi:para-nitrobenzyl esterase
LDVPFVFENIDGAQSLVGNGPESASWVAFARSGNPNHKGIPNWAPFDTQERATMIFNNECKAVNDPYRDERLARANLKMPEATA